MGKELPVIRAVEGRKTGVREQRIYCPHHGMTDQWVGFQVFEKDAEGYSTDVVRYKHQWCVECLIPALRQLVRPVSS